MTEHGAEEGSGDCQSDD